MSGYLLDLLVPRVREAALKVVTKARERREGERKKRKKRKRERERAKEEKKGKSTRKDLEKRQNSLYARACLK
jgi:hypothetical protein